jgi:hypothetical protein
MREESFERKFGESFAREFGEIGHLSSQSSVELWVQSSAGAKWVHVTVDVAIEQGWVWRTPRNGEIEVR